MCTWRNDVYAGKVPKEEKKRSLHGKSATLVIHGSQGGRRPLYKGGARPVQVAVHVTDPWEKLYGASKPSINVSFIQGCTIEGHGSIDQLVILYGS